MKRLVAVCLLAFGLPGAAWAHSDDMPIGPSEVWHHWSFEPWVWAPLLLAHWLYGRGALAAWARAGVGRIVERWRVAAFATGEIVLVIALISPLDPLGETLLSVHMAQHILLATLAPFLLVLGEPMRAWTWALPINARDIGRTVLLRAASALWRWLTRPLTALLLYIAALWIWHAPTLFDAALHDERIHTLEHLSFFGAALVFWSAMLRRRTPAALAALLVLIAFVQCGVLGAILTLAPIPLYAYGDRPLLWGLNAVQDQQMAGLLMWAPAGLAYIAAFVWFAHRAVAPPQARRRPRERRGIMRASTSSRSMK